MLDLLDWVAPALTPAFEIWGSPVTGLEVVAVLLSVWMVVCNMRVDPLAWPLAIGASLLYGVLFASSRLYGEAALQLFFVAVSAWGWHQWQRGRGAGGAPLRVHRLGSRARWRVAAATLAAWPALGLLLRQTTDSDVPFLDALPTVGSIAGQLLLGRKLIETWPVWIAVNTFSVALFALKGLWLTMVLYALFAALALLGWRQWQNHQAAGRG
jgi:nicotinamide mononucleotide transporter